MKKYTASLLFPLISSIFFLYSCHQEPESQKLPPVNVTAVTIQKKTIPATFEYVGVAQSSHLVEIRARVEGFLDTIAYKEGSLVHENELLFQIDPKPFEALLAQAKGLEDQQEALLWEAKQATDRLKPLYEQRAASKRDLDNAIGQELSTQASVDAAKAQVLQAEINLGYTAMHSPITGLAGQAKYREGALVGPGSNSFLTTVSAIDPIWVNFNVSEGDILKYQQETAQGRLQFPEDLNFEVEVILADGSSFPNKGKINFADPSFQQATGSMLIRAVLSNPENTLRPGQFVRAKLIGAVRPNAITVPQTAVMQGEKGQFVYIIDEGDQVAMRPVTAGAWYKNDWIIDTGLDVGDKVIVEGVNKLMPGDIVRIQGGE